MRNFTIKFQLICLTGSFNKSFFHACNSLITIFHRLLLLFSFTIKVQSNSNSLFESKLTCFVACKNSPVDCVHINTWKHFVLLHGKSLTSKEQFLQLTECFSFQYQFHCGSHRVKLDKSKHSGQIMRFEIYLKERKSD